MNVPPDNARERRPARILLVEDNPGDARLLETYLEESEFSYRLLSADHLSEALSLVGEERPDLCLLDLGLPDSEGVETIDRFRERTGDLPIVVLTGLDDIATATAALRAGAEEYLIKDEITPRTLGRTLRFVLERVEARRERGIARERWATVFDVSPVGLVISEADSGRLIEVNEAFVEMFGQSRDELLGSTSLGLEQWEDPDRRAELVEKVKEEGGFRDEKAWYRDAEGRRGRMLLSCRRLELAEGDHLLWAVRDITERVQRERALEERTHALTERIKEQSCLYDVSRILQDHEMSLDQRLQKIAERTPLGWQYPEVAVCRLEVRDETYRSDDFAEVAVRLEAAISVDDERVGTIEVAYREERPEEEIGPFLEEEQQLLEEVAGRVAVELERERVRQQRERLVEILENTSDFVGVAAADAETLWINQPGREMLGIPEDEEVRDVPIAAWSPDWAAEKILEEGLPGARERGVWEGETALLTREGEEIPVSQVIIAHGGDDDEPGYYSTIARDISDRKAAEREIREREARYRTLVETMNEAVTIAAPDGTITFANPAARHLFGGEGIDYVGEDLTDFAPQVKTLAGEPFPPEQLPFQRVVRTGEPVTGFEHLIERPDGTRIVVSVNAAPIEGEDGDLGEVVLSVRDVTERHRAEEWRHLLESSVEAAAHGILVTDREGEIVWTNPAFTDMTGYTREEALGENPRILKSGQQDEAFYEELWSTIQAGETWEGEIVNRRKDGTFYTEWQSVVPVRHRGEEITHFVAIKEDISEHKEREARYRTLVETMAEATVIVDGQGRITFANSAAEEVLGLERSDLSERTYDDPDWKITAPGGGSFPESELPFRRVMDTGESVHNVEHAITRPDGTQTILSVNAAPLDAGGNGSLDGIVATMRDVTEQKQLEAQLEHQALHDPLTGLANRALFEDRLEQALARSHRQGEPMGLLMIDLDAFKRINDSLGHTVGDEVLTQVARRLQRAVRETDTVARLGGDEFVVVLPELDEPEAIEVLQARVRQAVEVPFDIGDEELEITLTVGGVVHTNEDASGSVGARNPEDLARFADLALHRAKSRSPGGFYQFDPADKLDEISDLRVEQDLRRGLAADEIEVFYQPIVRLEDGSVWGLEALARWRHPERGLVSPGEFIPLAERVGLIHEIGDVVCQKSCRQVSAWNTEREDRAPLKIAVNLSARQLQDPDLTDRMREWMEAEGISPNQVVVEVTETAMMKTVGQAREFGALGVNLFIDDFGTGYSTFTYLRELDVQGLKLDISLVQGLPESESDAAIIDSMVTLANRLGLVVIAEGIETQAQLDALRELGCHLGQGFFLGRPTPAAEIEDLLDGMSDFPADAGAVLQEE